MTMQFDSVLDFGKYKRSTVKDVFIKDANYLCWLRDAKKKDSGDERFFSHDVLLALDVAIKEDPKGLGRNFTPWNRAAIIPDDTPFDPVQERPTSVVYSDEWGAF